MPTIYQSVATILTAAGYNTPPIVEQLGNYVLTGLGHDAAGNNSTPKYVHGLTGYNIPLYAATFTLWGVTDPPGIEKVANLVLT